MSSLALDFDYEIAESDTLPTPAIWTGIPLESLAAGHISGKGGFNFNGYNPGVWMVAGTDGDCGLRAADSSVGGIQLQLGAGDNDELILQGPPLPAFPATGGMKLAVEFCFKRSTVSDNQLAFFIGLADTGLAASGVLTASLLTINDGAMVDVDYIGFHVDQANGDAIDFVINQPAGAQTVVVSGLAVPVADEFDKLGFIIDYGSPPRDKTFTSTQRGHLYTDGTKYTSTYLTEAVIEGDNFPSGVTLAPTVCVKNGTAAATYTSELLWMRAAIL